MKKIIVLLIALALLASSALAETHDQLAAVPDFTVHTIDGEDLTLSTLLEEKDAVLLNVFATWCPPCQAEFPMLEAAHQAYGDRLAVIAVSAEPRDTDDVLDAFRNEFGLSFPVANIEGSGILDFLTVTAFPTTLLIDKNMNVCYSQQGSFVVDPQLTAVLDHLLSEDYDGSRFAFYGVYCYDPDEQPVEGVTVGFCTDATCTPVASDADGMILFCAAPNAYHLQLLKAPEGLEPQEALDETVDPAGGAWTLLPLVYPEG